MPDRDALARLEADGLVRRDADGPRTTRRWQAAMARAAVRLYRDGAPWQDLRLPIASALVELYAGAPDEEILAYVEALLPLEARELGPLGAANAPDAR